MTSYHGLQSSPRQDYGDDCCVQSPIDRKLDVVAREISSLTEVMSKSYDVLASASNRLTGPTPVPGLCEDGRSKGCEPVPQVDFLLSLLQVSKSMAHKIQAVANNIDTL